MGTTANLAAGSAIGSSEETAVNAGANPALGVNPVSGTTSPSTIHHHIIARFIAFIEAEANIIGTDISAEIAALRAKF